MCNLHIDVTPQRYPFLMLTALQSYWTVEIHGKMYPKNDMLAIYEITLTRIHERFWLALGCYAPSNDTLQ